MTKHWDSDEHALMAGLLVGMMVKAGIDVWMNVDDDGSYMNDIVVNITDPAIESMKVRISVLPPL